MDYFDPDDLEHEDGAAVEDNQLATGNEGSYVCDSCGEDIVIPLDISEGATQRYVEDCPVCCHPNVIEVSFDPEGRSTVSSRSEQDRY